MDRKKVGRNIVYYGGAILTGLLWGVSMGLISDTVVNPWLPAAVGFAFGAIFLPLTLKLLRRRSSSKLSIAVTVLNILFYFAFMIPLGMTLMLGVNKLTSHDSRPRTEQAVLSKHSETASRYRTVGRRRIYQGDEQKYYVDVILPAGHSKKVRVKTSRYVKTRPGTHIPVILRRGCLGFEVIDSIPLKTN